MNELLLLLFVFIGAVIWLRTRVKTIREDQRAVIFRMGKLFSVAGPGSFNLIPFIDKAQIVDLNTLIPEWKSLSKEELNEKVISAALHTF